VRRFAKQLRSIFFDMRLGESQRPERFPKQSAELLGLVNYQVVRRRIRIERLARQEKLKMLG
jgi:hypothetical protein